jgi:hypothetical protein
MARDDFHSPQPFGFAYLGEARVISSQETEFPHGSASRSYEESNTLLIGNQRVSISNAAGYSPIHFTLARRKN